MSSRRAIALAVALAALAAAVWWIRRDHGPPHYTGFVEGEERVVRSEVTGRVLEVPFREGATVPARSVVARLDDADVRTRLDAKRQELDVLDASRLLAAERAELASAVYQAHARRAELQRLIGLPLDPLAAESR